ncbi:hypothetical protein, conserved [Angomonas deanei]|uniref:Uncharacterized protein n=1 Tax=Angomonas deanei TaxID=59799 RepID=A0A7G2C3L9_9TRYP|nr:hypothetical protein, conserved [Angomonas deanei]
MCPHARLFTQASSENGFQFGYTDQYGFQGLQCRVVDDAYWELLVSGAEGWSYLSRFQWWFTPQRLELPIHATLRLPSREAPPPFTLQGVTVLRQEGLTDMEEDEPSLEWLTPAACESLESLSLEEHWQELTGLETVLRSCGPRLRELSLPRRMALSPEEVAAVTTLSGLQSLQVTLGDEDGLSQLVSGLPHLRRLTVWGIEKERDWSLRPLSALHQLERLGLHGVCFRSVEPLRALSSLRELDLSETAVKDWSPLADLHQLRSLSLKRCTSFTKVHLPPAVCGSLTTLDLSYTAVDDFDFLSQCPLLEELYLLKCGVTRLPEGCHALRVVDLFGSDIADLGPLAACHRLERVGVDFTNVSDLSPLRGLCHLQVVELSGCVVTDITPLADAVPVLRKVDLPAGVTSLETLRGAVRLEELDMESCGVRTLEPLRGLPRLKTLKMEYCEEVTSLEPLRACPQLTTVLAKSSGVADLTGLAECPSLHHLSIDGCHELTSLEALRGSAVGVLEARYNRFSDLSPLRACHRLNTILLNDCKKVASLDALRGHALLRVVGAGALPIHSVEPLATCPLLEDVMLYSCPHLTAEALRPLLQLPHLRDLMCHGSGMDMANVREMFGERVNVS